MKTYHIEYKITFDHAEEIQAENEIQARRKFLDLADRGDLEASVFISDADCQIISVQEVDKDSLP